MTGIVIQARTGSTRLPQKMILPFFEGKNILEILINRLKEAKFEVPIILATSTNAGDDRIEEIGKDQNILVFRGSERDVLSRFIGAADNYGLHKVIRICADNPFMDMSALALLIDQFKTSNIDYWCFSKKDFTPVIKTHYGFWGEGVSVDALKRIRNLSTDPVYDEHVTNYVYTFPSVFRIHYEVIDDRIEDENQIRLTIDTPLDFNLAKEIFSDLREKGINFTGSEIINHVKTRPDWLEIMKKEIIINAK